MSDGALNYALRLNNSGFLGPLSAAGGGLVSFGARIGSVLAPIAGLTGGIGALAVATRSLSSAANLEALNVSFEVLVGSAGNAKSILENIRKMGAATPYEFPDLTKGAQTMLAFGIQSEKILPLLGMLGDVGKGSADQMGSLTLALGQVSAAGKLTGQELLQFVNAGFNPLAEIAERTGESMASLRDRMEKGTVTFNEVEGAFASATSEGGRFHNMMEKMAVTTIGRYSTLKDAINMVMIEFGAPVNDALNPIIKNATENVEGLQTKFKELGESAAKGLERIYSAATTGQLGALAEAELKYAGANFINYIGENLNKAFNGVAPLGNFLGDSLESAGTIFEGALLKAAGSFSREFSGSLIEPIASALDFFGASGKAADLRFTAKFAASQNGLSQAGEETTNRGKGALSSAIEAVTRGMAGGQIIPQATLDQLKSNVDKQRKAADDTTEAAKKAAAELEECASEAANFSERLGKVDSFKPIFPVTPTAPAPNANVGGGALSEAMGGDFGESTNRRGLLNAKDSQRARFNRQSKADQAKNFGEFSEFQAAENSPLDSFLRKSPINSIGESNLLDKRFEGDALAKGSRLAGDAIAGTVNPASRTVGNRAREAAAKPGAQDLASILRKIEEHTAKFAEIAVA